MSAPKKRPAAKKRGVSKPKAKPSKPNRKPEPAVDPQTAKPGPRCRASRKVDAKHGGGEVHLFDAWKSGLPDLLEPPPEQLLAMHQWWIVHFPTRRAVFVAGDRDEGMRLLKRLQEGEDTTGLLDGLVPVRGSARARPDESGGRVAQQLVDKTGDAHGQDAESQVGVTPVPEGLSFDSAMKHVFPNSRITGNLERLLAAETPVYGKEGLVGYKPDYMTQNAALRLIIEHAQGRAGEKPPPPPEKKRITYEELQQQIVSSASARLTLKRLIEEAEAAAVAVKTAEPPTEGQTTTGSNDE